MVPEMRFRGLYMFEEYLVSRYRLHVFEECQPRATLLADCLFERVCEGLCAVAQCPVHGFVRS